MDIQTRREGDTVVLSVSGRLDAVTSEEYRSAVRVLIETGTTRIVIDLQELKSISSAGMSALVLTARWMKEKNGRFSVANLQGTVRTVIEMCGIENLLNVQPSVPELHGE